MTYEKFLKLVGQNIKTARVDAGLTQMEVEDNIGLTYRHYQNIEAGRISVKVDTLFALAKLFKVDPSVFLEIK